MRIFNSRQVIFVLVVCVLSIVQAWAAEAPSGAGVPAFPGAEGYGRFAQGGRGGDVYHVTNLNDDGTGSLRHGIESAQGPRTVVFDLSGTIELKSELEISGSHLTIAGQTAPGDGITLKDQCLKLEEANHIIIRYLRVRLGDENKPDGSGPDSITINYSNNIILDHISSSWGIDGNQDIRGCTNYTFQWSIMSEALNDSLHGKGPHAMCGSFRAPKSNISIHHNIFATSRNRHPSVGGSVIDPKWIIDFRNNVIYNQTGPTNIGDNQVNFIGNYFRHGPESNPETPFVAMKASLLDKAQGYMSGNYFEGRDDYNKNNYAALDFDYSGRAFGGSYPYAGDLDDWRVKEPYDLGAYTPTTHSAKEAYELVLAKAGASLKRDAVDERLVQDVKNRSGKLLDSQDEVGGWPLLESEPAPKDSDQDGMPDAWETAHGLDPKDAADRNGDRNNDGYTNLEAYLNSLVD